MGFIAVGQAYKRRRVLVTKLNFLAIPLKNDQSSCKSDSYRSSHRSGHRSGHRLATPPPETTELVDLPPEILLRIFSHAGFGKVNSLHLTCKQFAKLFSPTHNPWLLEMVAQRNSIVDLNGSFETEPEVWLQRFHSTIDTLLQPLRQRYNVNDEFHIVFEILDKRMALDLAILKLLCMDRRKIQALKSSGHSIVCGSDIIASQLRSREHYLTWKMLVLEQLILKINEAVDVADAEEPHTLDALLSAAEEMPPCIQYRDKHDLGSFSPVVKSVKIQEAMFSPVTVKLLENVLTLHETLAMDFCNPTLFVSRVLSSQIPISESLAEPLLSVINVEAVSSDELIQLLTAFRNCQEILHEVPLHERSTHHLHPLVDQLYVIVKTCLSTYHNSASDERRLVGPMWDLLSQIQIPELIDHVITLGGTPTCELL